MFTNLTLNEVNEKLSDQHKKCNLQQLMAAEDKFIAVAVQHNCDSATRGVLVVDASSGLNSRVLKASGEFSDVFGVKRILLVRSKDKGAVENVVLGFVTKDQTAVEKFLILAAKDSDDVSGIHVVATAGDSEKLLNCIFLGRKNQTFGELKLVDIKLGKFLRLTLEMYSLLVGDADYVEKLGHLLPAPTETSELLPASHY